VPRPSQLQQRYPGPPPSRPKDVPDAEWARFVAHLAGASLTALAADAGLRHGALAARFAAIDAAVRREAAAAEICADCAAGRPLLVARRTAVVELTTTVAGRWIPDWPSGEVRLSLDEPALMRTDERHAERHVRERFAAYACARCGRVISAEEAAELLAARWRWNLDRRQWERLPLEAT
jgi:hypothetical protein